jgi:hypothetical protein
MSAHKDTRRFARNQRDVYSAALRGKSVLAYQVKENRQNRGGENACYNGPSHNNPALAPQVPAAHSREQVKPVLFFIVRKPSHKPDVIRCL